MIFLNLILNLSWFYSVKLIMIKINRTHLKFLLNVSILCSYSVKADWAFDFLFTFYTCHSVLKWSLWSCAVGKTAVYPQVVHFITFYSVFETSFFFGFYCFYYCSVSSFYFSSISSRSYSALNCSLSKPLFYSFTITPTRTSTTTFYIFLQTWLSSLYLFG